MFSTTMTHTEAELWMAKRLNEAPYKTVVDLLMLAAEEAVMEDGRDHDALKDQLGKRWDAGHKAGFRDGYAKGFADGQLGLKE